MNPKQNQTLGALIPALYSKLKNMRNAHQRKTASNCPGLMRSSRLRGTVYYKEQVCSHHNYCSDPGSAN